MNGILSLICGLPLCGCSLAVAHELKAPPYPDIYKDSSRPVLNLDETLKTGDTCRFFNIMDKILKEFIEDKGDAWDGDDIKEMLWLRYLIAKAPLANVHVKKDLQWLIRQGDLDYSVKEGILRRLASRMIRDRATAKEMKLDSKAALEIFLASNAVILAQFRREIVPDLEETIQRSENEWMRNRKNLQGAEADVLAFFNQLHVRERRARKAESIVEEMEEDFVNLLVKCYPSKALEVKKYLRMAGYDDKQIPDLLDRTIGRGPQAEYLYKGYRQR